VLQSLSQQLSEALAISTVFISGLRGDEFKDKTLRVYEMWQTDFTYFKIKGWGWYYLSTILDD
jgi:putative transposase